MKINWVYPLINALKPTTRGNYGLFTLKKCPRMFTLKNEVMAYPMRWRKHTFLKSYWLKSENYTIFVSSEVGCKKGRSFHFQVSHTLERCHSVFLLDKILSPFEYKPASFLRASRLAQRAGCLNITACIFFLLFAYYYLLDDHRRRQRLVQRVLCGKVDARASLSVCDATLESIDDAPYVRTMPRTLETRSIGVHGCYGDQPKAPRRTDHVGGFVPTQGPVIHVGATRNQEDESPQPHWSVHSKKLNWLLRKADEVLIQWGGRKIS